MFKTMTIILFSFSLTTASDLPENCKLKTKKEAYEKAFHISGFDSTKYSYNESKNKNIHLDTITDDNIPLSNNIPISGEVWKVVFDTVELDLSRTNCISNYGKNQKKKTFTFYLDARTSTLLKITGQVDTSKEFFFDKFTKESLIKSIYTVSFEKWLSFPNENDMFISLNHALKKANMSDPLMAEEIYAVCVYYKALKNESTLVWQIIGSDLPKRFRTPKRMRTTVNAKTGTSLGATNVP